MRVLEGRVSQLYPCFRCSELPAEVVVDTKPFVNSLFERGT